MAMHGREECRVAASDGPPGAMISNGLSGGAGRKAADAEAEARQEDKHHGASTRPAPRAYDLALLDDLNFLKAWEQGRIPFMCAVVRVRQIRRANLAHGAQSAP